MRTKNTIPPRHARPSGRRFGTGPASRPPMQPRDAWLGMLMLGLSALLVISVIAGFARVYVDVRDEARAQVAAEKARRSSSAASEPASLVEAMRTRNEQIERAFESK